jgi:2-polyprenyl-6-methoxyphenol hydroxylase-like FAD-dependent oxidoreductase
MTNKATEMHRSVSRETGRGHAVVLGAGIAGLLAARVLADSYDRVTIIERDVLSGTEGRRGVPQGRHLHVLMARGYQIMEELFPGFTTELTGLEVPAPEVLMESRWYLNGLRVHPTPTGLRTPLGRSLLESVLRARTAALPAVRIQQRTTAVGLVTVTAEPNRIAGVRVVPRGGAINDRAAAGGIHTDTVPPASGQPDGTEVIAADLVVDATGCSSRAPRWLAQLGHARPSEESIDIDLGYSSCIYRRRPEHLDGDMGVVIAPPPGCRRGGGAAALEGDRWGITLSGMFGDHPPTSHEGYEAFAATLVAPDVYKIISDAEPLGDPVPYRVRNFLRRHYEELRTPPEGFLAIGDAICNFNPVYAQGMTVAALQAEVLQDCLRSGKAALPRRFYQRTARIVDGAWRLSASARLYHPDFPGRRPLRTRLVNAYVHRVHIAAHGDPTVARTFSRLTNLMEPPETLFRPMMMARVLRHSHQSR